LKQKLLLWGAGGHARVVADIVRGEGKFRVVGFIDDIKPTRAGEAFCEATVLGGRDALPGALAMGANWILIAIGDCETRLRLASDARAVGFELATAIHPSAIVALDAQLGAGTVLAAGSVVGTGARLGENVIVNTAASVDHECEIQDGAHIAPGVRLGGRVRVGCGAWIGIGAVVRDHTSIGEQTIIGAGAVVVNDMPARVVAYGVPARVMRELK
jgi:acetyltransferase EpsM